MKTDDGIPSPELVPPTSEICVTLAIVITEKYTQGSPIKYKVKAIDLQ